MIRIIVKYEIDTSKQEKFIEVMKKMFDFFKKLYQDVNVTYFFKWNKDLIDKVYYHFEFDNEEDWNDFFDQHQSDPRWIKFVREEYHKPNFVTPDTLSVEIIHELGQEVKDIPLGFFDYQVESPDV